jgi:hypothetical protein
MIQKFKEKPINLEALSLAVIRLMKPSQSRTTEVNPDDRPF